MSINNIRDSQMLLCSRVHMSSPSPAASPYPPCSPIPSKAAVQAGLPGLQGQPRYVSHQQCYPSAHHRRQAAGLQLRQMHQHRCPAPAHQGLHLHEYQQHQRYSDATMLMRTHEHSLSCCLSLPLPFPFPLPIPIASLFPPQPLCPHTELTISTSYDWHIRMRWEASQARS